MSSPSLLWLSRTDVERIDLPMSEIIQALETMFAEKGRGEVEMPPKPAIHPGEDDFLHAMPAWIPGLGAAGLKWVAAYPDNPARGLPYVSGLVVLNDPETGLPTAVMDATWITAKRTGAASAVGAKHLARPDASSLGVLGCGVQGRSHLEAMACLFELDRVVAYDIDRAAGERYAEEMRPLAGVEIEVADHPREAVEGVDLIVTAGPIRKDPDPTIEAGWMAEGAFACPVDFDSYWTPAALRELDLFVTDDLAQMRYYREEEGYFRETPEPEADLGRIVAGDHPGRTDPAQRTMTMNLGLAADDMATAIRILERARERGIGRELEL